MIETLEESIATEVDLEECRRVRMNLSFALFDLEIAQNIFMMTNPTDADYKDRLRDMNEALENYWQIDAEVTAFMQDARSTTEETAYLATTTVSVPMSPERRGLIKALKVLETAAKPSTGRVNAGSGIFAAIGRMIGNPGRMMAAK